MFLGRGYSFPIALEGALKLKELSYLHAEGYPAGEMKHGPLALIEDGLPVIILAPKDKYFEKTISNMQEVIARGGKVLLISDKHDVAILDDGFQDLSIEKDFSILCFNSRQLIGNGFLIPAGPLRESFDSQEVSCILSPWISQFWCTPRGALFLLRDGGANLRHSSVAERKVRE